jgi:hypothetical protein
LLFDGANHRGIFVAEVDAHELRGEVEVALTRGVDKVAACGVDDVERVPIFLEAPGAVVERFGSIDYLGGSESVRHGELLGSALNFAGCVTSARCATEYSRRGWK